MAKLQLGKSVQIANVRLNYIYNAIFLLILVYCVYSFIMEEKYTSTIANDPELTVSYAPSTQDAVVTNFTFSNTVCKTLGNWSYTEKNPAAGLWFNMWEMDHCPKICASDETANCTEIGSVLVTDSVFALRVRVALSEMDKGEQVPCPDGIEGQCSGGATLPPGTTINNLNLYPSALGATVRFTYQYALKGIPSSNPLLFGMNNGIATDGTEDDYLTVVLDANREIWKEFKPGDPIDIRVDEMVVLAHKTDFFTNAGVSMTDDTKFSKYPGTEFYDLPELFYRMGGCITAHVECWNDGSDLQNRASSYDTDWSQLRPTFKRPICLLYFDVVAGFSYTYSLESTGINQVRYYTKYEVFLITKQGSSYHRAWDMTSIILNLTSTIVLLGLPVKIIRFIALNLLGQLSEIYKRVVVQSFEVRQQCGSAAVKLMSNSVPFVRLADTQDPVGHQAISRHRMKERMKEAMRHRSHVLDDSEISNLAQFCFEEIVRNSVPLKGRGKLGCQLCEGLSIGGKKAEPQDVYSESVIDIDAWSLSMGSNEALGFDAIVKLFDKDRKAPLGERCFTPPDLWKVVHSTHIPLEDSKEIKKTIEEEHQHEKAEIQSNMEAREKFETIKAHNIGLQQTVSEMKAKQEQFEKVIEELRQELKSVREGQQLREQEQTISRPMAAAADVEELRDQMKKFQESVSSQIAALPEYREGNGIQPVPESRETQAPFAPPELGGVNLIAKSASQPDADPVMNVEAILNRVDVIEVRLERLNKMRETTIPSQEMEDKATTPKADVGKLAKQVELLESQVSTSIRRLEKYCDDRFEKLSPNPTGAGYSANRDACTSGSSFAQCLSRGS